MAPRGRFDFNRLGELASGSGSQREVIRRFRGEGFSGANDALRGLINAVRGANVSFRQLVAAAQLLVRARVNPRNVNLLNIPRSIEVTIRTRYQYRVVRNQLGRRDETLLSGTQQEDRDYVFPIAEGINARLLSEQALARAEETVNRLVADAGLAEAGNYLVPDIRAEPVKVIRARFTDFQ